MLSPTTLRGETHTEHTHRYTGAQTDTTHTNTAYTETWTHTLNTHTLNTQTDTDTNTLHHAITSERPERREREGAGFFLEFGGQIMELKKKGVEGKRVH